MLINDSQVTAATEPARAESRFVTKTILKPFYLKLAKTLFVKITSFTVTSNTNADQTFATITSVYLFNFLNGYIIIVPKNIKKA